MTVNGSKRTVSLGDIAYKAMLDRGFIPDFPPAVQKEAAQIHAPAIPRSSPPSKDMRETFWISIDNDDSLDLDQITFAEKTPSGKDKIYVAVADVDALVERGSAIDQQAAHNTTSVYVPTRVFPMLPTKLSTDFTSLNENGDRCSVVVEMEVDSQGQYDLVDIYPAWTRNQAKLTYNGVAAWLDKKEPLKLSVDKLPALTEQLILQDSIARRIKEFRYRQGALSFADAEIIPVMQDGIAVKLEEVTPSRSKSLIANLMIAANVCVTRYLDQLKLPVFRRVVRTPKRWDRIVDLAKTLGTTLPAEPDVKALRDFLTNRQKVDPAHFPLLSLAVIKLIGRGEYVAGLPGEISPGHFDLALLQYAHTTAPNRRYPDLIMQRLLKSHFYSEPVPYTVEEMASMAQHCTEKEDDATKVERRVRKSAIAMVFSHQIGQQFPAMVTGAGDKGTWVRLISPPVEGMLVQGFQGVDVGDHITVKLVNTDVAHGFIDFARV